MAFENGISKKFHDKLNEILNQTPIKKLYFGITAPFTLEQIEEFEKSKNKLTIKPRGNELHTK